MSAVTAVTLVSAISYDVMILFSASASLYVLGNEGEEAITTEVDRGEETTLGRRALLQHRAVLVASMSCCCTLSVRAKAGSTAYTAVPKNHCCCSKTSAAIAVWIADNGLQRVCALYSTQVASDRRVSLHELREVVHLT